MQVHIGRQRSTRQGGRAWLPAQRLILLLVFLCSIGRAAEPVEQTETWDTSGTAGWTSRSGAMALSNPNGYLKATHAPQYIPTFAEDTARADIAASIRITNIAFRFRAFQVSPSLIRAYIRSRESGNVWQVDLGTVSTGSWHRLSVPLKHAAGWFKGPSSPEDQFLRDLSDVEAVGVTIRRHSSTPAQNFAIDDFTLFGLRVTEADTDGDGIPDEWENQHSLNALDPQDRDDDADGDGMTGHAEFVAGTNPHDPLSLLRVEIESTIEAPPGLTVPVTLRWNSVSNRTYSVWQTLDLEDVPFIPLETGIVATPPVNEYTDPGSTNIGAGFYRVRVAE